MSVHLGRFTHEQRIEIANRLCKLILEKHRERVLAVCVYGSTAKKLDRPYSDLEMFVVVRDGDEIPMKRYLYRGLVVGIEYPLESKLLKAASKLDWSWHWEADGYRNRIVLFERDSWLSRLDQAVAVAEKESNTEAVHSSAMNLTKEMTVFQNTLLTDDPLVLKSRGVSLAQAADDLVLETGLRVHNETSGSSRDCGGSDGSQTIIKRTAEEVRGQVVLGNDGDSRCLWSLVGSERPDRLEGLKETGCQQFH